MLAKCPPCKYWLNVRWLNVRWLSVHWLNVPDSGNNTVSVASSVKNLGVYLDTSLTMERQVNAISKACYYQIRNIGHIRRYITLDACKTLAHALITPRLDYANALLYGLPSTLMTRLQKVQNYSARLVTRTHKREHITPVLNSLYWLPVIYRSQYKILVYTFKTLQGTAPQYSVPYQPTRSLRSEAAATLWNNLPVTIRKCKNLDTFKKKIKTNLFISAFPR